MIFVTINNFELKDFLRAATNFSGTAKIKRSVNFFIVGHVFFSILKIEFRSLLHQQLI
jgi:hypothetical protein